MCHTGKSVCIHTCTHTHVPEMKRRKREGEREKEGDGSSVYPLSAIKKKSQ